MSTPLSSIQVVVPVYYCDESLYLPIMHCLASLEGYDVILVDDCSPLDHDFPITIQNSPNLGYTSTVNAGLKIATADVIVVCNDDIVMTKECMERFQDLPDGVIASPMDTSSSDDELFGAVFGMRRSVYEEIGGLDENFKHFFSDTEYIQRAKNRGIEIIKWYDITLDHPESSTYKLLDKKTLLEEDRKVWERSIR